jgi:subtilase family serine protease
MGRIEQSRWFKLIVGALFLILCTMLVSVLLPADIIFPIIPSAEASAYPLAKVVKEGENPLKKLYDTRFACQSASAATRCYSPQQIREAYTITPVLKRGITGAGRTIVIVDAYQSPTIRQDLRLFDRVFNLPNPVLKILAPDGLPAFQPRDTTQQQWANEITLDVEWSHAIAPGAKITLVLAKGDTDAEILRATRFAVETNQGDVISQSFGEGESCSATSLLTLHRIFREATVRNITLLAASGDEGAAQVGQKTPVPCGKNQPYFLSASTPASDPLVTSIGGTNLDADAYSGQYVSETTWNDAYGASGGGFSSIFRRPTYQNAAVMNKRRGLPDVAFSADPASGFLVIFSAYAVHAKPMTYVFGGTSAGSPQWAGIVALADQAAKKRLGFINTAIYRIGRSPLYHAAFHDIVTGNNTFTRVTGNDVVVSIQGYDATPNWDAATGFGTPIVSMLIPLLIDYKRAGDGRNL